LLQSDSLPEPSLDKKSAVHPSIEIVRLFGSDLGQHHRRQPQIGREPWDQALEFRRGYADDGEAEPADRLGLADHRGIGAELALPEPVADDRYRKRAGRGIFT